MAYAYLPLFWHTLTSFCSYPDQVYSTFKICFKNWTNRIQSTAWSYCSCIPIFKNNIVLLNCTLFLSNILIRTKVRPRPDLGALCIQLFFLIFFEGEQLFMTSCLLPLMKSLSKMTVFRTGGWTFGANWRIFIHRNGVFFVCVIFGL